MSIRTLIAEDDPMVSNINRKFLEKLDGFQLLGTAKNGDEALSKLQQESIDLLLLDMYMPSLNGLELLKKVRSLGIKSDVIMITAADSPDVIEEAMRLGVVDFILKPYDYSRFESALMFYKKRYEMFRTKEAITQQRIDALQFLMGKLEHGSLDQEMLPKGIDRITLHLIRDTLQQSDKPLSAQNISDLIHLSRITTRKYLEFMAETGEIELDLKYSSQGRPTKLYQYAKDKKA